MAGGSPAPDGLSVVIPAWNDGTRLAKTLGIYVPALRAQKLPFEVIVVSDGTHQPDDEVAKLGFSHVRVVHFSSRLGKGGAIVAGLRQASFSRAGFVDADGPVEPEILLRLVRELDHADGVIAVRTYRNWSRSEKRPLLRGLLSAAWNGCARGLLLTQVSDTQCGAKFFRLEKLRQVLPAIVIQDWAFDLDLLYHWSAQRYTLRQVYVPSRDDPDSRLQLRRAVPAMLMALTGLRLYHSPLKRLVPPRTVDRLYRALGTLANGYPPGILIQELSAVAQWQQQGSRQSTSRADAELLTRPRQLIAGASPSSRPGASVNAAHERPPS